MYEVRFWGVRGSIATPGAAWARYGGNTSCIEVRAGAHHFILDGGTGLRPLGASLAGQTGLDLHLLLTHTHVDHLCGIPFFAPLYEKSNRVTMWAGHLADGTTLRDVLDDYMAAPLFPIRPGVFSAQIRTPRFKAGETIDVGLRVRTAPLRHPNGATGYRFDGPGGSLAYVTDTEHIPGQPDESVLALIDGADTVIYDCTYTDEEFPRFVGWGHSTWQEGVRLCDRAGVRRLVIFHHDPGHDDAFMDAVAAEADAMRPGTLVAREGDVLTVGAT